MAELPEWLAGLVDGNGGEWSRDEETGDVVFRRVLGHVSLEMRFPDAPGEQ